MFKYYKTQITIIRNGNAVYIKIYNEKNGSDRIAAYRNINVIVTKIKIALKEMGYTRMPAEYRLIHFVSEALNEITQTEESIDKAEIFTQIDKDNGKTVCNKTYQGVERFLKVPTCYQQQAIDLSEKDIITGERF